MSDLLEGLARGISAALLPVRVGFSSPDELGAFLARYGWEAEVAAGDMNAINTAFALEPLVTALLGRLDELVNGTGTDRLEAARALLESARDTVLRMRNLSPSGVGNLPSPLNATGFWVELGGDLVNDLVATYLERNQPALFALLHLTGVVDFTWETPAPAAPNRIPYSQAHVNWDALGGVLARPGETLNARYAWDVAGQSFDHERFIRTLERCLLAFGLPAAAGLPRASLAAAYLDPAAIVPRRLLELEAPLLEGVFTGDDSHWMIGAVLLPITDPLKTNAPPRGVLLSPLLHGDLAYTHWLRPGLGLRLAGGFGSGRAIAAKIYPGSASIDADPGAAELDASIELFCEPDEPLVLIGSADSHRLELDAFRAIVGVRGTVADPEVFVVLGTGERDSRLRLRLEFGGDDADGFVKRLAPKEGMQVEVSGNLRWSSKEGLSVEGSGALEFVKYIHRSLGPVTLEALYVRATAATAGVHLDLGVGLKGVLGPVTAVVDNVGVRITLAPAADGAGDFGGADLRFGFKPPSGVGLAVDAGAVKGGGYLSFEPDRGEYAGALELYIADFLTLKAIGLLNTRMPDGSKGFSLLIIITAEFATGIQLAAGFTLNGVGGLLGLNRRMMLQPLVDGVRSGAVNRIMFPQDVVANAPRIISDLRAFFPPAEGVFLIGPMAKLGWGTPTLVTLSLGLIIEIPGNVAILGVLKAELPTADAPVLVLNVNFVGAYEVDRKRAWFFAALFESRLLFMALDGEMGLLAAFGDDADFVLSVGGFHPRFNPPPLPFPTPRRISLTILDQENARIVGTTYFAVTTNTVQIGARVELYLGFGRFNLSGHLGFDALLRFSPFYFIIEASASMTVRAGKLASFSMRLELTLEGPAPWRARGTGSFELLGKEINVDFYRVWGEAPDTTLPPVAVMPLLTAELAKAQSWRAVLPASSHLLVALRDLSDPPGTVVLHPLGTLRVTQKAVPLDFPVDRVGGQRPSDGRRFWLRAAAGAELQARGAANESFARAQFQDMSDAQKLSLPAFEPLPAGLELAAPGQGLATGQVVVRAARYEEVVLDTGYRRRSRRWVGHDRGLFGHFSLAGSVSASSLSWHTSETLQPFPDTVGVTSMPYGVAFQADNQPVGSGHVLFASEAQAQDHLASLLASDPSLAGQLHVLPAYELAQ